MGDEVSAKELTGVNLVAEGPRLGDCLLVARLLSSPTVLPWLLLLVSVSESQAAPCTVVVTASSVTVALDSSGNSPKLLMTSDISRGDMALASPPEPLPVMSLRRWSNAISLGNKLDPRKSNPPVSSLPIESALTDLPPAWVFPHGSVGVLVSPEDEAADSVLSVDSFNSGSASSELFPSLSLTTSGTELGWPVVSSPEESLAEEPRAEVLLTTDTKLLTLVSGDFPSGWETSVVTSLLGSVAVVPVLLSLSCVLMIGEVIDCTAESGLCWSPTQCNEQNYFTGKLGTKKEALFQCQFI